VHADEAWRCSIEKIIGRAPVGTATKMGSKKDCDGVRHGHGRAGVFGAVTQVWW
jgi:hypothetical protein